MQTKSLELTGKILFWNFPTQILFSTFQPEISFGNLFLEDLENITIPVFSDTTPRTQPMEEIIVRLDLIKIKKFCLAKDDFKRMRRQAPN